MDRLDLLVAKNEIGDLHARYMRGQDRLDADLQHSVFWPDATADYGFFKGSASNFVTFAQDLLKTHEANHHLLGQSLIEVEGDVAFGELYYFAFHRLIEDTVPQDMIIAGRYIDRYERREGVWKIAHRSELIDWARKEPAADSFMTALPDALLGARGAGDRSTMRDWLRTA